MGRIHSIALAALVLAGCGLARAQSSLPDAPAPEKTASSPQAPASSARSPQASADGAGNPFPQSGDPESSSKPKGAEANPFPEDSSSPVTAPAAPGAAAAGAAVTKNPFPDGEENAAPLSPGSHEGAERPSSATAVPTAPPPHGYSSSRTNLPELTDEGSHGKEVSPADAAKREAHDKQVGDLYWNFGNWEGAYLRYRDAVATKPDDAEALFHLAEAEAKLGRNISARQHYAKFLSLAPDDRKAKDARKAVAKLPPSDTKQPSPQFAPGPKLP